MHQPLSLPEPVRDETVSLLTAAIEALLNHKDGDFSSEVAVLRRARRAMDRVIHRYEPVVTMLPAAPLVD